MLKPFTNLLANKTTSAFITNKKSPSVINVTGNVNSMRIGLTIKFNIANTTANTSAVQKLYTCIPLST